MSKITDNLLVKGARGKLGEQIVYKQKGDDTIITKMPKYDRSKPPSASQERNRDLFSDSQQYARTAIADPDLKAEYQMGCARGKAAYNAAMKDYRTAPVIEWVKAADYEGQAGKAISIHATDDFRVVAVKVTILTTGGDVVEEGYAAMSPVFKNRWIYSTQPSNPVPPGTVVQVTARDLPGNETSLAVGI
ncbi:hypothetical protein [Flavihumibacter petaseus]|uniref:Uncharacterized protein n=1 Tax=Flavihumibacter petaseus NBRC 106054 TaxID=1220578 RepID=A0A0E9N0M1_9BACT|nr:hypothetical protein [Flavihumibacter petaseus]GAO43191.1 hypothetical protein FPE01S_02_02950 [Flavihumibacter petaseus NBRC 106054]